MPDSVAAVSDAMRSLTQYYEMVTQNLANASTVGYRRQAGAFERVLNAAMAPGGSAPLGLKPGLDHQQGALVQTGRPLDLALVGNGMFMLETAGGQLFTRNGTFMTNAQRQIVDGAGRILAGDAGPIVVPTNVASTDISVGRDGTVTAGDRRIGKLKIVEFDKAVTLVPVDATTYRAPMGADPSPSATTIVQQGYQESSNVSVVRELVELIKITRLYEASAKTITTQDDRYRNLLRVAMGM